MIAYSNYLYMFSYNNIGWKPGYWTGSSAVGYYVLLSMYQSSTIIYSFYLKNPHSFKATFYCSNFASGTTNWTLSTGYINVNNNNNNNNVFNGWYYETNSDTSGNAGVSVTKTWGDVSTNNNQTETESYDYPQWEEGYMFFKVTRKYPITGSDHSKLIGM